MYFSLAAALLAASSAQASTFEPVSLRQLTTTATAIVRVNIVETTAQWNAGHDYIETLATVEVTDVLGGDLADGEILTVREVGGEVDGYHVSAVGFPKLEAGADLVVFLTTWPQDGSYRVHEFAYGIYEVVTAPSGQTVLMPGPTQDTPGATMFNPEAPVAPKTPLATLARSVAQLRR